MVTEDDWILKKVREDIKKYIRKKWETYRNVYGMTERNAEGLEIHLSTHLDTSVDDNDNNDSDDAIG